METTPVQILKQDATIRHVVLWADRVFRRDQAVETIAEAFFLFYFEDTDWALHCYDVGSEFDILLKDMLVVVKSLQESRIQI